MNVTLAGAFIIANGSDRQHQVLAQEQMQLSQQNSPSAPLRAEWPKLWPTRATRFISLSYPVTFAPCANQGEAVMQARSIPAQCPKGGVLVEYCFGTRVTYADSQVASIEVTRTGVTNQFVFSLEAIDPTVLLLALDGTGQILQDGTGQEIQF